MSEGQGNALLLLMLAFYLLPAIIAWLRRHRNQNPIAIVNIFFGWTIIGWVATLAWAFTDNVAPKKSDRQP